MPTRLVHSAKSWLSNADVDRTAKILPWDAGEGGRVLSPVEVSTRFLSAIREAWDQSGRFGPLTEHDVVLTVPASFDEEARELTVKAAEDAGLPKLTLIEEPAAAFYSWIANNFMRSRKLLFDGQIVLICDVGGGTSDFSLISVSRDGDKIDFTRTAVGKHLLLGGDNLDLTLAWLAESKLGKQLSIRQRSGLRRQCSAAKEILLCDPHRESVEINVLGGGSSIIGGTMKTEITRAEALELTLEGFLPLTPRGEKPKEEKRSLFRELGLPYVSDPAISRHLAAFLESRARRPTRFCSTADFSSRKSAARAWPTCWKTGTAGGRRFSRTAIWISRWQAARLTIRTFARPAPACWCAADCRALIMSASPIRLRCVWCRAGPRKATVSKWIAKICSWSRTSRWRSG